MYRVLIAEDEMLVRLLLKNSIDWNKFEMTLIADVSNGEAAWESYQETKPDLIITDLRMPLMGGMELIAKIREKDNATKIIILTCVEEFDLVRKALSFGVTDYILKLTMSPEEMEVVLRKVYLDLRKQAKPALIQPSWDKVGRKEALLKNFMFRGLYNEAEFRKQVEEMELRMAPERMRLCLVEIDHLEKMQHLFKDKRGYLIQMSLQNVLDEVLAGSGRGEAFFDKDNRFILVFSFADLDSSEAGEHALQQIADYIRMTMRNYFNASVSIAVSRMTDGYAELKSIYEHTVKAIDSKFFLGLGQTIRAEEIESEYVVRTAQAVLAQLTEDGLGGKKLQELEKAASQLIASGGSSQSFRELFSQWMPIPISQYSLQSEAAAEIVSSYGNTMRVCETLGDLVQTFENYKTSLMELRRSLSLSWEVKETIKLVQQRYREDLTLQQAADATGISPNYLTSLLKKEIGMSFLDYLISFRIDKAKELLIRTNDKAYEIMEQVGFSDQSYFSKMFKKVAGLRPSEYRRQATGQSATSDSVNEGYDEMEE